MSKRTDPKLLNWGHFQGQLSHYSSLSGRRGEAETRKHFDQLRLLVNEKKRRPRTVQNEKKRIRRESEALLHSK